MPPVRSVQAELGRFLRARRERLLPADVGLAPGARRRAPGLRREEVALLANVSTTYYTFLEQGRNVRPSRQILDALAGALRLSATEQALLHQLVEGAASAPGLEQLAPGVAALVDRMDPYPAYVSGRRFDVLAANRCARALFVDWDAVPHRERNIVWFTLADPRSREIYRDWEQEAAAQLGRFRAAAAQHPGDPDFAEFAERLYQASPVAREWWDRQEAVPLGGGMKRLRHPELGDLDVHHVVLQVADAPEQKLVTFAPAGAADEVLLQLGRG
jgi:transcriptional regulator with XRE-family HTH domain